MSRQRRKISRPKKPLKKRVLQILACVLGVFFLLLVLAGVLIKVVIDEDFLVDKIEQSINSDVEIDDLDISIFSNPAQITLRNVRLSPRGADVAEGREPVRIEEIHLSASLWSLLGQRIDVSQITIRGADITTTYRKDGSTTLGELFASPEEGNHPSSRKGKRRGLNVFDQEDFVASLGGLSIKDSRVDITLENTGIRLRCTDVNVELSSIKIDPSRLEETNTATLTLLSKVRIDSTQGWAYGDLSLSGKSTALIFNPRTGDIEPDITGDFSLGEDSWLNTRVPLITSAWNYLSVLEPLGIKVAELPERATFGRSESIAAHYHRGRITVLKPLSIWVGDWELAAMENSWLQTQTDQHEIRGELLASKSSSVYFLSLITKGVGLFPESVQKLVLAEIEQQMFRDSRLWVKIKSSGDFSSPTVRPDGSIVDLTQAASEAAKKLIGNKAGDFLRGLLGGDGEDDE